METNNNFNDKFFNDISFEDYKYPIKMLNGRHYPTEYMHEIARLNALRNSQRLHLEFERKLELYRLQLNSFSQQLKEFNQIVLKALHKK